MLSDTVKQWGDNFEALVEEKEQADWTYWFKNQEEVEETLLEIDENEDKIEDELLTDENDNFPSGYEPNEE
jgi:hypothetical protein